MTVGVRNNIPNTWAPPIYINDASQPSLNIITNLSNASISNG